MSTRAWRLLAAATSGGMLAAAHPPWGHWWLAWVGLVPLGLAVGGASVRLAGALGWLAGTIMQATLLWWTSGTLAHFSSVQPPVSWLVVGLVAALAGWPLGLAMAGLRAAERRGRGGPIVAAALFVVAEWLGTWLPIPHAWGLVGATQVTMLPMVQVVELTGVLGLSGLIVATNMALVGLLWAGPSERRRQGRVLAVLLALVAAVVLGGALRLRQVDAWPAADTLRVGLVHTAIDQARKWGADYRVHVMGQYGALTGEAASEHPAVVLWPETAVPFYLADDPAGRHDVETIVRAVGLPLVLGSPAVTRHSPQAVTYTNRAYVLDATGRIASHYDKRRLVPFGEYVPYAALLRFVRPLIASPQAMTPGTVPGVVDVAGARLGVLLCYESAFAGLARDVVRAGATVLVNLSNDAWFAGTGGTAQALAVARLRAVETRRPLVRVASGGWAAIVAPSGRVVWAAPPGTSGAHVADVPLLRGGTVYTRTGDLMVVGAGTLVALWALASRA